MSDQQLALNESQQALTELPVRIQIARHISNILSPAVVSLPFILLVALYHTTDQLSTLWYALTTLFFLSIGPLAYIVIGVKMGKFTDVDVSLRAQRTGPFLFGIASSIIGLFILIQLHAPKNLETVLIAAIVSGVIMMITTLWWKISIHASSLAGAITILTALYGRIILPAFLLVVLVSWSRVVLRRHTLAQVIGGASVSILLSLIILSLRGI